jgi:hypothetical protein
MTEPAEQSRPKALIPDAFGPWLWFVGEEPDVSRDGRGLYNLAEERTREEAISAARPNKTGGPLHIIEARCFQYRQRGEAEDDPIRFAETRNHEIVRD